MMSQLIPAYVKSRPSATVVLVRDGESGPELLLVQRHAKSTFGASFVFPGGVLEAADESLGDHSSGLDDAGANAVLGMPQGGAAYFSGAIRELFEEAGILLARTPQGRWADPAAFSTLRDELNAGNLPWTNFVREAELILAYDALHYFSHWVTPRELPKRFSTRFFVAALPGGQVAAHCGGELTDSCWLSAPEAIAAGKAGKIELPQPTIATLHELSGFLSIDAMLAWAAQRSSSGVNAFRPAIVSIDGSRKVVMPDSPDYPDYSSTQAE
jgi:8-oxo-dGTP pyrophosphatase MutT (NUDIX family)